MPTISFNVFIDKIISGEKKQTIRPAGKRSYKPGDRLYMYTGPYRPGERIKIGTAVVSEVVPIKLNLYDSYFSIWAGVNKVPSAKVKEIAIADGFTSSNDMIIWFIQAYKLKPGDTKEFNIIKWRDFVPA